MTYSPCQVSCNEGYSILGPNKLQCLSTGQYDHAMPQCVTKPVSSETFCGQRNDTYGRVYGGAETIPGEFPWNVLIEFDGGRFCGGSIIGDDWVLSAGHCLLRNIYSKCSSEDSTCRFLNPERSTVRITAGVHDRDDEADMADWQERFAITIFVHPLFNYQAQYIDYDVGLIRVDRPFVYNSRVNRVCLPQSGVTNLVGNPELYVSGWGRTNSSDTSSFLQKITVPYVSRDVCNSNLSYSGNIRETMFCAGYPTGKVDACQGDSGGPLVYLGPNGTFVQGGIVSWGKQCAKEHFYGVYTNLAYFYDWIVQVVSRSDDGTY